MKRVILLLVMILLSLLLSANSERIAVPAGEKSIVIDGNFVPGEWDDALKIKVSAEFTVFLKMAGEFFLEHDGREFWISLGRLPKKTLKMACGIMFVSNGCKKKRQFPGFL